MSIINEPKLSVRFYLYQYGTIEKELYPVYIRVIYHRQKTDLSARMFARPDDWDTENGLFHSAKAINRYNNNKLLMTKDKIIKTIDELREIKPLFTMVEFRKQLRGIAYAKESKTSIKLLDFYDQHISECRNRKQEYGEGVIATYMKARKHLFNFMVSKGILNITLHQLSRRFIVDFENYLLTTNIEGRNYTMNKNTASNYLKKLKAVVNKAREKELLESNPFFGFKIPRYRSPRITYLNEEELEAIASHTLFDNQGLITVRDFFLFSCFTGLRFSDSSRLRNENVRKDRNGLHWIRITQKKTKETLEIPLLNHAVKIFDKYEEYRNRTGYVLPHFSHTKVNTYLKNIGVLAGIKKNLTHHVARHTFATTVTLERGIDLKTVSTLLGHSSIKSTEIYSRITKTRLAETIKDLNRKI